MKKLLIIVPSLALGGQECVAVNMAQIMASDYDVAMVIFDGRDAVYAPDCEVIDLNIPAAPGKLQKIRNAVLRGAALRKLRRKRGVDFSISFGPTANLANVMSGKIGKTVVRISSYADITASIISRFIYKHSDAIICCAEEIQRELTRRFPSTEGRAFTIRNPFELKSLRQQGNALVDDYVFSKHVIVTHGRLNQVKNYPRLIKAFSIVKEQITDARLVIIGEGGQRSKLEALITHYNLSNSVTLLGFRKNPFAYLARSSVYVLSSYHEGFPNALVEGMCFLPVVAVDCKTGPREILSDGSLDKVCDSIEEADYGILVRPAASQEWNEEITDDDRLLAEAILSLLENPQKREEMRKRAAMRAQEFSFERFREELQRALEC